MIQVRDLCLKQGDFELTDVSFKIETRAYAILMGKTGSGKTTILEAVCGLRSIEAGEIRLLGRDVTNLKPAERGVGYVPQDLALFPHMTVYDHLAFALKVRGWDRDAIEGRVVELAKLLGIRPLLHRKPHGLSGGESQRVALGRALSFRPRILLLDEPLSALDEDTREEMYGLLRAVQRHTGVTTLHITHSRMEANQLGDCILKVHNGRIQKAPLGSGSEKKKVQSHQSNGTMTEETSSPTVHPREWST